MGEACGERADGLGMERTEREQPGRNAMCVSVPSSSPIRHSQPAIVEVAGKGQYVSWLERRAAVRLPGAAEPDTAHAYN